MFLCKEFEVLLRGYRLELLSDPARIGSSNFSLGSWAQVLSLFVWTYLAILSASLFHRFAKYNIIVSNTSCSYEGGQWFYYWVALALYNRHTKWMIYLQLNLYLFFVEIKMVLWKGLFLIITTKNLFCSILDANIGINWVWVCAFDFNPFYLFK